MSAALLVATAEKGRSPRCCRGTPPLAERLGVRRGSRKHRRTHGHVAVCGDGGDGRDEQAHTSRRERRRRRGRCVRSLFVLAHTPRGTGRKMGTPATSGMEVTALGARACMAHLSHQRCSQCPPGRSRTRPTRAARAARHQRRMDGTHTGQLLHCLSSRRRRVRPPCPVTRFATRADLLVANAVAGCVGVVALTARAILIVGALVLAGVLAAGLNVARMLILRQAIRPRRTQPPTR
jgi:hypothetical protein